MQQVKSWIVGDKVFVIVGHDDPSVIKCISKDKFVENYNVYVKKFPKESKSKICVMVPRKAIERCHKCEVEKPITEFNCYALLEAPCFECCSDYKKKLKFTLPLSIWEEDFDIDNIEDEVGFVPNDEKKKAKVKITDIRTNDSKEFPSILAAGRYFGMNKGHCSKSRLLKKVNEYQRIEFPSEAEPIPSVGGRVNQKLCRKKLVDGKVTEYYSDEESSHSSSCESDYSSDTDNEPITDESFLAEVRRVREWAAMDGHFDPSFVLD